MWSARVVSKVTMRRFHLGSELHPEPTSDSASSSPAAAELTTRSAQSRKRTSPDDPAALFLIFVPIGRLRMAHIVARHLMIVMIAFGARTRLES